MHTNLGLFHPLALGLSHFIYGQPLDPMGIHFFNCTHGGEIMVSHDAMWDAFASIMKKFVFMLHVNKPTFFCLLPSNLHANGLTLCFQLMVFACWLMSSLLTPFVWTWFCMLHYFGGWPQWWQFKQRKDFIEITIQQTCFSLLPLRYSGVYINKSIIFFIIVLIWHELQSPLEAFLF
jgi:hypothetical protein